MGIHPTYIVIVEDSEAQGLLDALRAPRDADTEPGLGPERIPSDPTGLPGLRQRGAPPPNAGAPMTHREITISIPTRDAERFEAIVESTPTAQFEQYHPRNHPVDLETGDLDESREVPDNPAEKRAAVDLERIRPEQEET